ncbi:Serine/threonine-protein kinase Nek4 [Bagarius yarrelli]|uniref:Serine/threonine-protein kinase Nek4 n=1 Tax=Bagarius yarrelli TaxID=175774 RepID=A0A556V5F6_BAGYA|nr:Serine/threonine-protein kinase Nek4 [Bagarius yarrelli]
MESYVFIRVVGKGSYGEVNLVQHKSDRKQYVIKKLNLRTSSKRERRAAEQEAQLLSQLKHPNIVTYRESWEGNDYQLYIVMGFCEGGDLYHRLKQQKGELLPERQVVEWFVQIAMALQYLHEKHILHRDLKTQNIFLTKTNIIKVGDLGIARVLENHNDMASTLIGTPYYMSPELFSNKPYNYKSDVWALGCCVYEMATLKHAFNAKDMNSLVYRIVEGKLPQMPSKYDLQLGELIKRMLCKRPEDRPDVKHILRQPYIKQQIAVFLEATKEKTARSRKRVNGKPNRDTPAVSVLQKQEPQCVNPELTSRGKRSEENHSSQSKHHNAVKDNIPPIPPKPPNQNVLNSSSQNIATVSNIDIDIQPQEHKDKKIKPPQSAISIDNQTERERERKTPRKQESGQAINPKETGRPEPFILSVEEDTMKLLQQAAMGDVKNHTEVKEEQKTEAGHHSGDRGTSLESTDKLLEPFIPVEPKEPQNTEPSKAPSEKEKCKPPLYPLFSSTEPSMSRQRRQRKREVAHNECQIKTDNSKLLPPLPENSPCVDMQPRDGGKPEVVKHPTRPQSDHSREPAPQNRLLSARERRRLRQSRENQSQSAAAAVRKTSCDVAKQTDQPDGPKPANAVSLMHRNPNQNPFLISILNQERKASWRHSDDEEECSSSTSSTERSEGDYREGKSESTEMQDLVQMMTQTLRMDVRDVPYRPESLRSNMATLPEFKLNRKYRDTLMLHGKSREEERDFHLSDVRTGDSSGPAKIRRAVEHLRTDVVKGLGVKLLDKVLLRQQMGEEKYQSYAVMVRQLKFFEDVAFKSARDSADDVNYHSIEILESCLRDLRGFPEEKRRELHTDVELAFWVQTDAAAGAILPFESGFFAERKVRTGDEIPVVITAPEERLGAAVAAMNSISRNSKANVVFSVVTLNETWLSKTDIKHKIITFEPKILEGKISSNPQQLDLENPLTFARFFMPNFLPDAEKAIYLDDDVIVQEAVRKLGLKANTCSFNPGVIVANLTEWKQQNVTQQLEMWMERNVKESLYSNTLADSFTTPPLLIVFYKRHSSIEPMWHVRHLGATGAGNRYSSQFISTAKLLHWNGHYKPWGRTSSYTDVWDKWYIPDPTGKFRPIRRHTGDK